MKTMKKFMCVLLVVLMCLTSAPLSGFVGLELPEWNWKANATNELAATGQCGDNVYWNFDSATGELVISGTGAMWDYAYYEAAPFYKSTIESIIIENGITAIGDFAFPECKSLTNVKIGKDVLTIGYSCFSFCYNLNTVDIGNNVESIGSLAFHNCVNLIRINIPDSVVLIGGSAFESCSSLESIDLGVNVTTIKECAFYKCGALTSITIPNSVISIGDQAFYKCVSIVNITIPNSVTSIGDSAFSCCYSLKSITIPDSVMSIGNYAFYYCHNLTSVTIPDSVTRIESNAFEYCESLKDVYFYGTEEQWNNIDIGDYNKPLLNATIHFLGEEDCTHKETFEQTIPASCTVSGMKFTVCVDCGETIGNPEVIPAAHTPGEWETVIEPTYEAEGKKVKKCTVCGETLEEEIIPKLELAVVEDEETGVGLEFPAENYDGKVEIEVEESFDGTAFNILDTKTGAVQQKIYDIKMLVDGEVTQPNGKITVRIPLPAGYNPKFSFVYYVNTETGAVEKMDATYEDGYMVFETDHFSYYAVIAEPDTDNCSCNCHAGGIKGFFFKFLLFFQKIFRTNKVCKCGINHY